MALPDLSGYNAYNHAADPSAEGEVQRNDYRIKAFLGGVVRTFAWLADILGIYEDFNNFTGFHDKTTSEVSFVDGTRTLTIQPVAPLVNFDYYHLGTKITSIAKTKVINDTEGVWWFWLDSAGVLQASQTRPDFGTEAFVTFLYWNAEDGESFDLGEERHLDIAPRIHEELHNTVGMTIQEGLAIGNYTTAGAGDLAADAQCSISDGVVYDEDIKVGIANAAVPSALFEQILSTVAEIPIYYRDTTGTGDWKKKTATVYPVKEGAARIQYNKLNGSWDVADATSGYFVATWIFATNNIGEPVIGMLGQRQDNKIKDARNNNTLSGFSYGAWPFEEMKPLYRLLFETKDAYGNAIKARLIDVIDLRSSQQQPGGDYVPSSHPALGDRDLPGQHPADAIETDVTSFDGNLTSADDEVQAALDTLDDAFNLTFNFSIAGAIGVGDDQNDNLWLIVPRACVATISRAVLQTGPTDADFTMEIEKSSNDGGAWSTVVAAVDFKILDGAKSGNKAAIAFALAAGDVLRLNVDQVGATVAGSDLSVVLLTI